MLNELRDNGIFEVSLNSDKSSLTIIECCDYHYSMNITKQQLNKLIKELSNIYKEMKSV